MQQCIAAGRNCLRGVQSVLVDPDDLAWPNVAHHVGADEVERAGLGRDHPVVSDLTERERSEPEWVTERDERAVDESRHRIGAFKARHCGGNRFGERRLVTRDERGDDLRVEPCRELDAVRDELGAQLLDVHEIAVVPERDGACSAVMDQRLRVRPFVGAGRRVARVADRHLAGERLELLLVEGMRDEAHLPQDREMPAVGDGDPCGFLAAVL